MCVERPWISVFRDTARDTLAGASSLSTALRDFLCGQEVDTIPTLVHGVKFVINGRVTQPRSQRGNGSHQ
jgi:hypothetical protein